MGRGAFGGFEKVLDPEAVARSEPGGGGFPEPAEGIGSFEV
jgi:hypothetical protein